jgi:hypothetical protein
LAETLLVTREEYLTSADPVFEARTTRGQTYYSDSRMLLLELGEMKPGSPVRLGDASLPLGSTATGTNAILLHSNR